MLPLSQTYRKRAFLLSTGQTTSYGSGVGVDDGALQKGLVKSYTVLAVGQYSGTTNITINSKTDAHNNNCVVDNLTGLMWSRTASGSIGPASDGKLPWTTTGSGATAEGIFPYCTVANVAGLAGYSDWRIPNIYELISLSDYEAPNGYPNPTAFPTINTVVFFWSSTTRANFTTNSLSLRFTEPGSVDQARTVNCAVLLVRG